MNQFNQGMGGMPGMPGQGGMGGMPGMPGQGGMGGMPGMGGMGGMMGQGQQGMGGMPGQGGMMGQPGMGGMMGQPGMGGMMGQPGMGGMMGQPGMGGMMGQPGMGGMMDQMGAMMGGMGQGMQNMGQQMGGMQGMGGGMGGAMPQGMGGGMGGAMPQGMGGGMGGAMPQGMGGMPQQGMQQGMGGRMGKQPINQMQAEQVCQAIRKATKGLGTNEDLLISTICGWDKSDLEIISRQYMLMFQKDLIKLIKSECRGKFEDALVTVVMPRPQCDAMILREAMKGLGTDEKYLIDVLTSRTNMEIQACTNAFRQMYNRDLMKDVKSEVRGDFEKILVTLLMGGKDESGAVNQQQAQMDANALYKAGKARMGTDEQTFTSIFGRRSRQHLQMVSQAYQMAFKRALEADVKSELSGWYETCVLALMAPKGAYTADLLYEAMKGLGTNESALYKLICSRDRHELEEISNIFFAKYRKTLFEWVRSEVSGDFRKVLLARIAGQLR